MPFESPKIWSYDEDTVQTLSPNQRGVYGIFRSGRWIYVGSGDIRDRLLSHLRGDNHSDPCIAHEGPTHWIADVTAIYKAREVELSLELTPQCGERVG